jgi:hypothetical protein
MRAKRKGEEVEELGTEGLAFARRLPSPHARFGAKSPYAPISEFGEASSVFTKATGLEE